MGREGESRERLSASGGRRKGGKANAEVALGLSQGSNYLRSALLG